MNRRLALATATALSAAAVAGLATTASATENSLSSSCRNGAASALLRHSGSTGAYWATGTISCTQTYQFTVVVTENGRALSSTHFGRYGGGSTRSGNAPTFTPMANASYRAVVTVPTGRAARSARCGVTRS